MKYNAILFDLDGTLWDSRKSLIENWNRILSKHQLLQKKLEADDMNQYMGLLIKDVLKDLFPTVSSQQILEIMRKIEQSENESIRHHGGILYMNVEETLKKLAQNHSLFIVSNCQDGYIEAFMDYFGFRDLFTDFESHGRTQKNKEENIRLLMKRNKLEKEESVYIGDTQTDYQSATANGIDFLFCNYGFGHLPDNVVVPKINNFNELLELTN